LGIGGRIPRRVDAVTKAGLLGLLDEALAAGWSLRRACQALEFGELRAHRWLGRRARGALADRRPDGSPLHGLLAEEAAQILALFEEWGETDRSHRKLAHRGSYLGLVWVSPSSVRRVLFLADKHFRPLPRPGRAVRRPFPAWAEYTPKSIWIYDTTHFPAAGMAVLIIDDLVSRKWLTEVVSVEETSTQLELGFTQALQAEGLGEFIDARQHRQLGVDAKQNDETKPILLAVSDNGPQIRSGSTREFLALCAIAQHFGGPHTPTDQAWIESPNGHLKAEYPHLLAIRDPATLRAELAVARALQRGEAPRRDRICLPRRRTRRTRGSHPQGPPARTRTGPSPPTCLPPQPPAHCTRHRSPAMANRTRSCIAKSETRQKPVWPTPQPTRAGVRGCGSAASV